MNARILVAIAVAGLVAAIASVALLSPPTVDPATEPPALDLELNLSNARISSGISPFVDISVEFVALNNSPETVLLQYVKYVVFAGGESIHAGLIGERPEGFVASSNFVTLLEGVPVDLADSFEINTAYDPSIWDAAASCKAMWTIEAEASYSRSSITAGGERLGTFSYDLVPDWDDISC